MSKATEKQVRDLEAAHKEQFHALVAAAGFLQNLIKSGADKEVLSTYIDSLLKLVVSWYKRQRLYEQKTKGTGAVPVMPDGSSGWFFQGENLGKLQKLVKSFSADGVSGIGFIPLLIWGAIVLISAIAGVMITNDLTTTTQERESLIKATQKVCTDLHLTPAQCEAMINNTQVQASSSGGSGIADMFKWASLVALTFLGVKIFIPNKSN